LPTAQQVYDLRLHRSLGRRSEIEGTLQQGEPLIFALTEAPVGGLSLSRLDSSHGSTLVRAGEALGFSVRQAGDGASIIDSAVHVEVQGPSGRVLDYYGGDYSRSGGQAEFSIPLALNDPPGRWQVTAREPFSHQTAQIDFRVSDLEWRTLQSQDASVTEPVHPVK